MIDSTSAFVIIIAIVSLAYFLMNLADALERKDFDPITRLTWVVVLIFVPFFGVIFYHRITRRSTRPVGAKGRETYGTPWAKDPAHGRASL